MSDDEADIKYLVCATYHGHWEMEQYREAVIRKAACGHLVWVASAGQRMWDESYAVCLDCYKATVLPDDATLHVAPGAIGDIRRVYGDEVASRAGDWAIELHENQAPRQPKGGHGEAIPDHG